MAILDVLGFELEVELPYKYIAEICKELAEPAVREALHQMANNFVLDVYKTTLPLYYHPKLLAACCAILAVNWRKK